MSRIYSIEAMNQLADALEQASFSGEDLAKLKQFKNLVGLKNAINGLAEIVDRENIIDFNLKPFTPRGWVVDEHLQFGKWPFDINAVSLYRDEKQKNESLIGGHDLRINLVGRLLLNANVLDFLIDHPNLIPEPWKEFYVFFWGTLYRNQRNELQVRGLVWDGRSWNWLTRCLDEKFRTDQPALIIKSQKK